MNNHIYALSKTGCVEVYQQVNSVWKQMRSVKLELKGAIVTPAATMTAMHNSIHFFNRDGKILQFSFAGELLQTVTVDEQEPVTDFENKPESLKEDGQNASEQVTLHEDEAADDYLCAVDADGRMLLIVGIDLVLQHNDQSDVFKLDGITEFKDIVFADQYTFWIINVISHNDGKWRLVKYNIA